MRNAILIRSHGGPEVMTWEAIDSPVVGPQDLLVDVHAAGVNFIDTYQRSGLYDLPLPFTPGSEGSGTVSAVGPEVDGFSPGDRVAWIGVLGSYSTQHVVPARQALKLPNDFDMSLGAAIPLQGMTAHYLACSTFPVADGHTCVIHAAAGGTGRLLTQIAVNRGARVIAVVGSTAKVDLARSAGAHHVIDTSTVGLVEGTEAVVGKAAVDVVFDGVGAATFDAGIELLRPRGMMVTFGNASGAVPPVAPLRLMPKSLFLTRPKLGDYIADPTDLAQRWGDLTSWIAGGSLQVNIGLQLPVPEAAEAHRRLEGRQTTGKVLLLA